MFSNEDRQQLIHLRAKLFGSFLLFTQFFFHERTGKDFKVSNPVGRVSHHLAIATELTKVLDGHTKNLIINIPPRFGKTEFLIHFVAWTLAQFPDSNYLYVSVTKELAAKATSFVRDIVKLPAYRKIFNVEIRHDSDAASKFMTTQGGCIEAVGIGGTITGKGSGIKYAKRFGGCTVIDDIHKSSEVLSDVIREKAIDDYYSTLENRRNDGENTPTVFIGQRQHEHDLAAHLLEHEQDKWTTLIMPELDEHNHPLDPEMHSLDDLLRMKRERPYEFASQRQQNPVPAGGALFKENWFLQLQEEPQIIVSFITADTAETDKTYNDPTVFSFWGIYKIVQHNIETDLYAIHWLDCVQLWVEPKDLKSEFMRFYAECMRYHIKPQLAAIEKKSTGTTLLSVLSDFQGLEILDIERTSASGNKASRYLETQTYASCKRITFPRNGRHTQMCIDHMSKITANNTHKRDDIADTYYDAVKIRLMDKLIINRFVINHGNDKVVRQIAAKINNLAKLKRQRKW